jgi:hypothetical protein
MAGRTLSWIKHYEEHRIWDISNAKPNMVWFLALNLTWESMKEQLELSTWKGSSRTQNPWTSICSFTLEIRCVVDRYLLCMKHSYIPTWLDLYSIAWNFQALKDCIILSPPTHNICLHIFSSHKRRFGAITHLSYCEP